MNEIRFPQKDEAPEIIELWKNFMTEIKESTSKKAQILFERSGFTELKDFQVPYSKDQLYFRKSLKKV